MPIAAYREQILKLLKDNFTLVLVGETGCGKTTQLPQMVYDSKEVRSLVEDKNGEVRIAITQPRRVAAVAMARRVADERGDPDLVSYTIRFDGRRRVKRATAKLVSDGPPVGAQFVASRYREDVALAAAEAVEAKLGTLCGTLWAREA